MKSPYTGKAYAKGQVKLGRIPEYKPQVQTEQQGLTVRGKRASSYEYNVGLALDSAGLEFLFQVSYWGGRRMAGGMVLDFLVFTAPLPTPVFVQGDYFHQGQRKSVDSFQAAQLDNLFNGQLNPTLFWYGEDTSTPEAAISAVKRDLL